MKTAKSFAERRADEEKLDALSELSTTERLLAHILIELMDTRARRSLDEIAQRLRVIGLSTKQVAALLDTTPASLAGLKRRRESGASTDAATGDGACQ